MKIALIQSDIVWGSPAENCAKMREAVMANPGADLYVLPEMFSTGFLGAVEEEEFMCDGISCGPSFPSLFEMRTLAAECNCAIAGSIAVCDGGTNYNRFFFVKPDRTIEYYDKKHLFTYSGEQNMFAAGDRRVVVEWKDVRFLLEVCYDLRFPVWARNRGDYDAILYVASWPAARRYQWDTLLRARAIENQCFVVGVNRVGSDPSCSYSGGSVILDPWGKPLAEAPDGTPSVVSTDLDMDSLQSFRASFPVLNDADGYSFVRSL